MSIRQHPFELCPPRSVADDDEFRSGHVVQDGQVLHLLLGGEAADVADDLLTIRCH